MPSELPWFGYSESPSDGALNTGTPWSELGEHDMRYAIEHDHTVAHTTNYMCRTQYEVRAKAKEMGLRFKS